MKNTKEIKKLLNELVDLLIEEEPQYSSTPISTKSIKINKIEYKWSEVTKDTWRDETSGLIWLPIEPKEYTHYEAEELQTKHKRLPTIEEFEQTEKHGIREIIDMKNNWFWSSSAYLYYPNSVYGFSGVSGDVNVGNHISSCGVICVVR